jgi:hypothetical protein
MGIGYGKNKPRGVCFKAHFYGMDISVNILNKATSRYGKSGKFFF